MAKTALLIQLVYFALFGLGKQDAGYPPVENESFQRGELLQFKMTYGIFTVGRGTATIGPNYLTLDERDCFKVDISAQTVGLVNWVTDVHNHYYSYIDTASLLPLKFYRSQREGGYRKDEETYFDHSDGKIVVKAMDQKTGRWKEPVVFQGPEDVRDIIGGFLFLRNMDFTQMPVGDTILVRGFFEDEFYTLRIIFKGRTVIRTPMGKIRTLILKPIMPSNKLFEGENSITAFFSDDKNRIPVKIEAKMFIGTAGVELTHFSGLRNAVNRVRN